MKYAFAGDRKIAVNLLKFLIEKGHKPLALLVTEDSKSTHSDELIKLSGLKEEYVYKGKDFIFNIDKLKSLDLDYIFGIHFPYIVPKTILDIPKIGFLNLHPAYLPYNKGWHTPTWAIVEGTKYGATLHYMTSNLDEGDIIHQKELIVHPSDTANVLYQRVLTLEEEVFKEAFDDLQNLKPKSIKQKNAGTAHFRKDLKAIQKINLDKTYTGQEIINLLRGLTTNKINEGAFFVIDDKRYYMQLNISKPHKEV